MIRALPLLLLLLSAPVAAQAQEQEQEQAQAQTSLDALLEPIRAKYGVPALGGAIVTTEKLVAVGAVGVRKHDDPARVTHDDLWHLGSCTKAMTATLVGVLVDRGVLSWETTVGEVFPELRADMHPSFRRVTIAQLLSHRAGIPKAMTPPQWKILRSPRSLPDQRRALVASITGVPSKSPPGSSYEYSNQGYVVVGAMLERLTKTPWEDLMTERLFKPLGMASAGFGPPGSRQRLDQPRGHRDPPSGRRSYFHDNPPGLGPAGTVHASLQDWAKFVAFHLRGAKARGGLGLRASTLRTLHTPPPGFTYALGWQSGERSWGGGRILTHSGSNTLWYCVAWLAPKKGFAVLAVTNVAGTRAASRACDEVAGALIARALEAR